MQRNAIFLDGQNIPPGFSPATRQETPAIKSISGCISILKDTKKPKTPIGVRGKYIIKVYLPDLTSYHGDHSYNFYETPISLFPLLD